MNRSQGADNRPRSGSTVAQLWRSKLPAIVAKHSPVDANPRHRLVAKVIVMSAARRTIAFVAKQSWRTKTAFVTNVSAMESCVSAAQGQACDRGPSRSRARITTARAAGKVGNAVLGGSQPQQRFLR